MLNRESFVVVEGRTQGSLLMVVGEQLYSSYSQYTHSIHSHYWTVNCYGKQSDQIYPIHPKLISPFDLVVHNNIKWKEHPRTQRPSQSGHQRPDSSFSIHPRMQTTPYSSDIFIDSINSINLDRPMQIQQEGNNFVVGSYSDAKQAPSLYLFDANRKQATSVLTETNPSYVVRHHGYYYVLAEHQAGLLITLNENFEVVSRVYTMGDDPCQATIDATGQFIVTTNYSSASIIVYRLTNHLPSTVHSFITHEGSSLDPDRQTSPHPHSTIFSEDNHILFVSDLGTDIIYWYTFTLEKTVFCKEKSIKLEGAGPRTICRGKAGSNLLYLTCELDNTVRILSYQNDALFLTVSYKVSMNPLNYLAEIRYLNSRIYVSMRGDDKIMIFGEKQQRLQQECSFKVGGWPRYFTLTEEGVLYVACQKGNLVQKYQLSEAKITLLSQLAITTPSCIVVL